MRVVLQIFFLLICSFSTLIVLNQFPTDGLTKAKGFLTLGSIILFLILIAVLLLSRISKNKLFRTSVFYFLIIGSLFLNYKIYPNYKYSPKNLHAEFNRLEKSYDTINLNSYSDGVSLTDKIKNKMLRHKFSLKQPNYYIKYYDLKNDWKDSKSKSFPLWILKDSILTNNPNLRFELNDSIYVFNEDYENNKLKFLIGYNGLDNVENFYTGGGTHISETGERSRESGTIDQNRFRIVVSKDPNDDVYGKDKILYNLFLKFKLKGKKTIANNGYN